MRPPLDISWLHLVCMAWRKLCATNIDRYVAIIVTIVAFDHFMNMGLQFVLSNQQVNSYLDNLFVEFRLKCHFYAAGQIGIG